MQLETQTYSVGGGLAVRNLRWGFKTEIKGCGSDCKSVTCGLCQTFIRVRLPIKTREDEEIKVPSLRADAHKSAAIGSQGLVEMWSCKNIFSSLTCHPWSRDAQARQRECWARIDLGGRDWWGLSRGPQGRITSLDALFEGRPVVMCWVGWRGLGGPLSV